MLIYLPHLVDSLPHLLNIAKACRVENISTNSLLTVCLPPPLHPHLSVLSVCVRPSVMIDSLE